MSLPDIDIDFADRTQALNLFKHTPAKLKQRKHNTGVYFHRVPSNPFTNICTVFSCLISFGLFCLENKSAKNSFS